MSIFQHDCPHCGTKNVAFSIIRDHAASRATQNPWDTLAVCGLCSRSVLATFKFSSHPPSERLKTSDRVNVDKPKLYPESRDTTAPEHTPGNAADYYRQGMENLARNWDAAGMMFRKALDAALKFKFPDDSKKSLNNRIKCAAGRHELTPELAEWAHQIRLDGNEAAHEEAPFSEEDAKRLQVFTDLVFRYLFTLPGMMNEARQGEASAEDQTQRQSAGGKGQEDPDGELGRFSTTCAENVSRSTPRTQSRMSVSDAPPGSLSRKERYDGWNRERDLLRLWPAGRDRVLVGWHNRIQLPRGSVWRI